MKDTLWLVRNTLNVTFKKKRNLFAYFGLPIIGILVSLLLYGNVDESQLRIGIVNNDNQMIAADTIQFIEGLDHVAVTTIEGSEMEARIAAGRLDSAIVFESGFSRSVQEGQPGHIRIVSIKGAEVTAYVKAMLYNYVDNVAAISKASKGDSNAFNLMYSNYKQSTFKLNSISTTDATKNNYITYQTIGFLIMFMLFSAVNLSEMITKEKENRTYLRLLSTPISARQYVGSNVIVNLMIMTMQIIMTLFFMKVIFQMDIGVPVGYMFLIMMIFALVAIGLSLSITAFASSSAAAGAIQNIIITPTCLLAGCFFPIEIMPDMVKKISGFLPQHWLLVTITELMEGKTLGSLYVNLLILGAFALAFFLIAIYRFGRNNDTRSFV